MSAPPYVMRSENEKILWSDSRFIYEKITFDLCKCLCFQVPVPIISVLIWQLIPIVCMCVISYDHHTRPV